MNYPPFSHPVTDKLMSTPWVHWIDELFRKQNRVGTTAQRPKDVEVGDMYMDTTIAKPIWVRSVSPIVWITAAGAVV